MTNAAITNAQSSVDNVIDTYGSTVVITPMTNTEDKWGDKTESDGTPVSTLGIPYNIMSERFNFIPAGDLVEGDIILILKNDETIYAQNGEVRYKITFDSIDYDVISVEDYDVADTTLAKQVVCRKRI